MAESLHNDEILMKYLDGEMNESEKTAFEHQLQIDASLRERLNKLQLAIAAVQQYGTTEKVKAIHAEMMQELNPSQHGKVVVMRKVVRYSLAIAASVIIILVGINIFTSSQLSSDTLYKEAFVDYNISVDRSNGQQGIVSLYQQHKYEQIIAEEKSRSLSSTDSFLVGMSYLKTGQIPSSIDWLRSISSQNPNRQDAEFYLSLAHLKNKNYAEALKLMEQIHSDGRHVYHNQFSDEYIAKVKKLSKK